MAQPERIHTSHTETHTDKRSGTGLALIIGGLVVAVALIAWFLMGGDGADLGTATTTGAGETNIQIEAPEGGSATSGATAEGSASAPAETTAPDASAPAASADAEATTAQ
ncbi:hypothetical protein BV394_00190 [Brevirhabdus pacifica]|uniref:Uncharacterized protein n=1 Tax=Brevirhabdus pacifica TaxID=1267768 RepID=A0A1U7DED9_9RHOB|nr:hypothetical protein [Brevirhabdus pacifica]APX88342.1 hypothetical protein BV394_00190 [Brevirhabdus pacifica]OWU79666.1 hypothetical protein ATO5_00885 [Loktanella sp. 22II-4b]PJJ87206.1 hypothetical protein CLV77_1773 [Brevirhabdus pacifica]